MFTSTHYVCQGINHDGDEFTGEFTVQITQNVSAQSFQYTAVRNSDAAVVHRENGFIGSDDQGKFMLVNHMEELPCVTVHVLVKQVADSYVFEYEGTGSLDGFKSELVFEFNDGGFRYLHRWAMGGDVSDESWCLLKPV